MIRLALLSGIAAFGFTLLILAVLLFGKAQPPPEAISVLHLDVCALPCWNEVTLGQTPLGKAFQRMEIQDDRAARRSFVDGEIINAPIESDAAIGSFEVSSGSDGTVQTVRIHINANNTLMLGDIVNLFGTPTDTTNLLPRIISYNCESISVFINSDEGDSSGWQQPVTRIIISHARYELPPCPAQTK